MNCPRQIKIMATQTRKRTTNNKTKTPAKTRRKRPVVRRSVNGPGNFANFFVPLFFILCILFCLGFLAFMGYRTVTASDFFEVKNIDVRGAARSSKEEIERIVRSQTEKSGVWNADLAEIKNKVERLVEVKSAAVSRVLPDGVRVNVAERIPKAVVRLDAGDFWADDDAVILGAIGKTEERPPFVLRGWDETKTDGAAKENQLRVKIYQRMLEDWREFDLSKRVEIVDLTSLRTPQAIVQDSGETVTIFLAKEDFGKRLQTGLKRIAGRGKELKSIDVSGNGEVLGFRVN